VPRSFPPSLPPQAPAPFPIAFALRRTFRRGYTLEALRADVLAGLVVGIVALPLSMALAIAVGAPPQHGLYTAIVAGLVIAPLGGSKFQVSGPTAAFVVVLAPIVTEHGLPGLLTAGFMAGCLLVALGAFRLGNLVRYVPYPVTTGFTAGIAVVIATLQVKDALGLQIAEMPAAWHEKVLALWAARGTASPAEASIAAVTILVLVVVAPRSRAFPAPLLAIGVATALAALLRQHGAEVATIGSRFAPPGGGPAIPATLPWPSAPWGDHLTFGLVRELLPSAIAIALLGAIESLLSAVVSDAATGTRHDPDAELVGQGIGNLVAPFFGGIAATGALARTATNIRAGARSPFAAMVHAVVVLVSMVLLAPLVAWIPMASLAGLLLMVAWNMSERHNFGGLLRVAPRSDVAVLLTCFTLTILFDMTIAVGVGFVLAAVLFLRRMSEITGARFVSELDHTAEDGEPRVLPPGVALYEINGPLFFGAAQKAMDRLHGAPGSAHKVLVVHLGRVPVIDATGFAALENVCRQVVHGGTHVVLAGPLPSPREVFDRADLPNVYRGVHVAETLDAALREAARLATRTAPPVQRKT
jgi:SulP family sulfate permease